MIPKTFYHRGSNHSRRPLGVTLRLFDGLATLVIAGMLLFTACAPQPAPGTSTLAPIPTNQTYTVKPDDQTQARLRIGQCIYNGPDVDIYINGKMTQNGGVPFILRSFDFSGYLYLPPGKVKVAVTLRDASLDKALFAPLDLTLEAGHRYTVAVLGQAEDTQHNTLVIDETKVFQETGAPSYTQTYVNNLKGVEGFDSIINGKVATSAVPYGGYKSDSLPKLPYDTNVISVSGAPDKKIDISPPTAIGPDIVKMDSIICLSGKYPGTENTDYGLGQSPEHTDLSLLDYLKKYTELNQALNDPSASFNTFLALVKTAGMTDLLNNSPHLIFVPTDQAFFLFIPKPKLDEVLADPKAAEALLKEHIVDGYYPYGSLSHGGGFNDRTLTAMSGRSLKLFGDPPSVNGDSLGDAQQLFTANGSRFYIISHVMQRPK